MCHHIQVTATLGLFLMGLINFVPPVAAGRPSEGGTYLTFVLVFGPVIAAAVTGYVIEHRELT